jgi:POT family proton-dependent oligopeptide transporter
VRVPPEGSVIVKAWRCYRSGLKPQHVTHADGTVDTARSWDDKFITELRQTAMACKVFLPMTIYWVAYSQIFTNLISQAADMDRPASVPNDIMSNLDPLALIIFIPIMDFYVFPLLARFGIEFYAIKRITFGFVIAALSMAWSGGVQYYINNSPAKSISVWWQIPSYVLIAFSEIFASIASIEYSYSHAPESMKSLISAFSLFPNALSSIIGILMAPLAAPEYITGMYIGISVVTIITSGLFWYWFRDYDAIDKQIKFSKHQNEKLSLPPSQTNEKTGNV